MAPLLTRLGQAFGFGASTGGTPTTVTGGTKITSGADVYHVFTYPNSDSLTVSGGNLSNATILIVGGGGASNCDDGGGGGAGGVIYGNATVPFVIGTHAVQVGKGATMNGQRDYDIETWGMPSFINNQDPTIGIMTAWGGQGGANHDGNNPYPIDTPKWTNNPWGDTSVPYSHWGSGAGGRVAHPTSEEAAPAPLDPHGQPYRPNFGSIITNYGSRGGGATNGSSWNSAGGGGAADDGTPSVPNVPEPNRCNGGNGQPFPAFPAPVIAPAIPSPKQSAWTTAVGPTGLFAGGGGGTIEAGGGLDGDGGTGGGADGGNPGVADPAVYGTGGGGGSTGPGGTPDVTESGGPGIVIVKFPAASIG